jgi:hypothetical protein
LNIAINFSAAFLNGHTMFRDYLMNNPTTSFLFAI